MNIRDKIPKSIPLFVGVALGFGIGVGFLPGGFDAYAFYLRWPPSQTVAPAWIYFITYPLGLLKWPIGWQVLTTITILVTGATCWAMSNRSWWIVAASAPMLWNIWLGQIEVFPIFGILISTLVINKKLNTGWLAIAWLALATKPQVGLGALVLVTWWVVSIQGWRELLLPVIIAIIILAVTILIWPGWPVSWLAHIQKFQATWWNASIWPYGLVAWPLALLPRSVDYKHRLRMVNAATLLGSPYFAHYHSVTLLTLCDQPFALLLSWIPVGLFTILGIGWMRLAWIFPAAILLIDVITYYINKGRISN
jgi:hypothetical protein